MSTGIGGFSIDGIRNEFDKRIEQCFKLFLVVLDTFGHFNLRIGKCYEFDNIAFNGLYRFKFSLPYQCILCHQSFHRFDNVVGQQKCERNKKQHQKQRNAKCIIDLPSVRCDHGRIVDGNANIGIFSQFNRKRYDHGEIGLISYCHFMDAIDISIFYDGGKCLLGTFICRV